MGASSILVLSQRPFAAFYSRELTHFPHSWTRAALSCIYNRCELKRKKYMKCRECLGACQSVHSPVLQRAHSGEMATFTELQKGRKFLSSISAPARWSPTFLILFLFLFFPPWTYLLESNLVCSSDKHVKHLAARKMFFFFLIFDLAAVINQSQRNINVKVELQKPASGICHRRQEN